MINLAPIDAPGHSPLEVFTHCLPEAALALALWYLWLEKPISSLFGFRTRDATVGARRFLLFSALGIILGATSHVVWDAASHSTGWFVQNSELLQETVLVIPNYKWIQYSGGVLGWLGLGAWYLHYYHSLDQKAFGVRQIRFFKIFFVTTASFVALANLMHGVYSFKTSLVQSMAGAFTGAVISLVVYATIENLKRKPVA